MRHLSMINRNLNFKIEFKKYVLYNLKMESSNTNMDPEIFPFRDVNTFGLLTSLEKLLEMVSFRRNTCFTSTFYGFIEHVQKFPEYFEVCRVKWQYNNEEHYKSTSYK